MDCSFKSFYFFISFVILLLFIGFESSVLLVQAPEFPMEKVVKQIMLMTVIHIFPLFSHSQVASLSPQHTLEHTSAVLI